MRRHSISAVICAVILLTALCGSPSAADYDFHAGVYTSYEYTDNYQGTAHDRESENIYEIGPSAQILISTSTMRLDLSGHAAQSFHRNFDDDDFTNILLNSRFETSTQRDTFSLVYGFTQNNQRSTLDEVSGESRIHSGTMNYTRALTPASTVGLGYTYNQEVYHYPNDDVVSHGVNGSVSHRLTPRDTVRVTGGYDLHYYEYQGDTWVGRTGLSYNSLVTEKTTLGVNGEYQHQGRIDQPDGDITSVFLTMGYSLAGQTHVNLSGGYNWLSTEDADRESSYAIQGELTHASQNDTLSLIVSKEYTAEFETGRYGIYDTQRVSASWRRSLKQDLFFLTTVSYDIRDPVSTNESATLSGEDRNFTGMISLNWQPLEYVTFTASYTRLEQILEISDTVRENRYRLRAEVRY